MSSITKNYTPRTLEQLAKAFSEHFNLGMEHIQKAAEAYVEALDYHDTAFSYFRKSYPQVSAVFWRNLERVGRHLMIPEFLTNEKASKTFGRLPVTTQKAAMDYGIEILVPESNDILKVKVTNMTPTYYKQAFTSKGELRDVAGQKAWVISEKVKAERGSVCVKINKNVEYEIGKNVVHILKPTSLTKTELISLLAKMNNK